jgi:hypothetical protein
MNQKPITLRSILAKTTVVHTLTYFIIGIIALNVFHYSEWFSDPALNAYMRPTDDPLVTAGVLFQPIRGVLFGIVFYLLREVLFGRQNGWLVTWVMLVFVGILSTFGPAPSSIEGMVYTKLSFLGLWGGVLEVLAQSFLLSIVTYYWVNHPEQKWLTWVLVIGFVIVLVLPILGLWAMAAGLA